MATRKDMRTAPVGGLVVLMRDDLKRRGVPYSDTHLERLERKDQFPRHIQLSANRVGWLESEVNEWLRDRIAARDAKPTPVPAERPRITRRRAMDSRA